MPPRKSAAQRSRWMADGQRNRGDEPIEPESSTMKTISLHDAVALIPEGATLMVGGFLGVGSPERVMDELVRQGKHNLVLIANDTAAPGVGIGKLVTAGLLRKVIVSHIGLNPETQQQMLSGKLEV